MKAVADERPDAYYIVARDRRSMPDDAACSSRARPSPSSIASATSPAGAGQGIYHEGTRHLSLLPLRLDRPPAVPAQLDRPGASSHVLTVDLTNPDCRATTHCCCRRPCCTSAALHVPLGRRCFERIGAAQPRPRAAALLARPAFAADFARHLRGARHAPRRARPAPPGHARRPTACASATRASTASRATRSCSFEPAPTDGRRRSAACDLDLQPGAAARLYVTVGCSGAAAPAPLAGGFDDALDAGHARDGPRAVAPAGVRTSSDRSTSGSSARAPTSAMMITRRRTAPIPTPACPGSARRSAATASSPRCRVLWVDPSLARGVLLFLAATQATTRRSGARRRAGQDPARGARRRDGGARRDPVRPLLRQRRRHAAVRAAGRRATTSAPAISRPSRGSGRTSRPRWRWIDATATSTATASSSTTRATERRPDQPGLEGFARLGLPRRRHAGRGADRAVRGAGLRLRRASCTPPSSRPRSATSRAGQAAAREAERLQPAFEQALLVRRLGTYALALDGDEAAVPGACRRTPGSAAERHRVAGPRAARRRHAARDRHVLGLGRPHVRDGEARYNPMSYHNGSIWPHDTALVGARPRALRAQGRRRAHRRGLFAAAQHFDLRRLPELFCGFARHAGEGPTRYPVACAPQAWASAASLLIVQALLGLEVDGIRKRVTLRQPRLPAPLEWMRLTASRSAKRNWICCASGAATTSASAWCAAAATSRSSPSNSRGRHEHADGGRLNANRHPRAVGQAHELVVHVQRGRVVDLHAAGRPGQRARAACRGRPAARPM